MPKVKVTDSKTGKSFVLSYEGAPPTQADIDKVFARSSAGTSYKAPARQNQGVPDLSMPSFLDTSVLDNVGDKSRGRGLLGNLASDIPIPAKTPGLKPQVDALANAQKRVTFPTPTLAERRKQEREERARQQAKNRNVPDGSILWPKGIPADGYTMQRPRTVDQQAEDAKFDLDTMEAIKGTFIDPLYAGTDVAAAGINRLIGNKKEARRILTDELGRGSGGGALGRGFSDEIPAQLGGLALAGAVTAAGLQYLPGASKIAAPFLGMAAPIIGAGKIAEGRDAVNNFILGPELAPLYRDQITQDNQDNPIAATAGRLATAGVFNKPLNGEQLGAIGAGLRNFGKVGKLAPEAAQLATAGQQQLAQALGGGGMQLALNAWGQYNQQKQANGGEPVTFEEFLQNYNQASGIAELGAGLLFSGDQTPLGRGAHDFLPNTVKGTANAARRTVPVVQGLREGGIPGARTAAALDSLIARDVDPTAFANRPGAEIRGASRGLLPIVRDAQGRGRTVEVSRPTLQDPKLTPSRLPIEANEPVGFTNRQTPLTEAGLPPSLRQPQVKPEALIEAPVPPVRFSAAENTVEPSIPGQGSATRVGVNNRENLQVALQDTFGYTPEQAEATSLLAESFARGWAKETGRKTSDWYSDYTAGITKAEPGYAEAEGLPADATGANESARKYTNNPDDARRVILALTNPDASTGIHELMGHTALLSYPDAETPILETFLGPKPAEGWSVAQQEKHARATERYLADGVAPNPSLQGTFARFKGWLEGIYRHVKAVGTAIVKRRGGGVGNPTDIDSVLSESFNPEMVALLKRYFGDVSDLTSPQTSPQGAEPTPVNVPELVGAGTGARTGRGGTALAERPVQASQGTSATPATSERPAVSPEVQARLSTLDNEIAKLEGIRNSTKAELKARGRSMAGNSQDTNKYLRGIGMRLSNLKGQRDAILTEAASLPEPFTTARTRTTTNARVTGSPDERPANQPLPEGEAQTGGIGTPLAEGTVRTDSRTDTGTTPLEGVDAGRNGRVLPETTSANDEQFAVEQPEPLREPGYDWADWVDPDLPEDLARTPFVSDRARPVEDSAKALLDAYDLPKNDRNLSLARQGIEQGRTSIDRAEKEWEGYTVQDFDPATGEMVIQSPNRDRVSGEKPEYTVNLRTGDSTDPHTNTRLAKLNNDLQAAGIPHRVVSKHLEIAKRLAEREGLNAPGQSTDILFQRKQQETPEFKRFFGDWQGDPANASKVVDSEGKPLVVYHGTDQPFTRFQKSKANTFDDGHYGKGFYFTPDESLAKNYGKSTMPVYLDIRKPFTVDDSINDITSLRQSLADVPGIPRNVKPNTSLPRGFSVYELPDANGSGKTRYYVAKDSTHKSYVNSEGGPAAPTKERAIIAYHDDKAGVGYHEYNLPSDFIQYAIGSARFTNLLKKAGYDGVVTEIDGKPSEMVAFNPEQIKSATGNNGQFDPNNPDILFQRRRPAPASPAGQQAGSGTTTPAKPATPKPPPSATPKAAPAPSQKPNPPIPVLGKEKTPTGDVVASSFKAAMLSNPLTPLKNILQAVTLGAGEEAARVPAVMVDMARVGMARAMGKEADRSILLDLPGLQMAIKKGIRQGYPEAIKRLRGIELPNDPFERTELTVALDAALKETNGDVTPQAFAEALKTAKESLDRKEAKTTSQGYDQTEQYSGDKAGNRILDIGVNGIFRLQDAADRPTKIYGLYRSLSEQSKLIAMKEASALKRAGKSVPDGFVKARAKELFDNPSDLMQAVAVSEALSLSLSNENALSSGVKSLKTTVKEQNPIGGTLLDTFSLPFDKVPTNAVLRNLEFSLGSFSAPLRAALEVATNKRLSPQAQREFARTFGRGTAGLGAIALGYYLAGNGMMTGYDATANDYKKRQKDGQQEGSLFAEGKNGEGRWLKLSAYLPGTLMAIGATIREREEKFGGGVGGKAGAGLFAIGNNVMEVPAARASDPLERLLVPRDRDDLINELGKIPAMAIPSVIGSVASAMDDRKRDTKTGNILDPLKAKIPGLRQTLPEKEGEQPKNLYDPFASIKGERGEVQGTSSSGSLRGNTLRGKSLKGQSLKGQSLKGAPLKGQSVSLARMLGANRA